MNARVPNMPVQIYVSNGSFDQSGTAQPATLAGEVSGSRQESPEQTSAQKSGVLARFPGQQHDDILAAAQAIDPYQLHKGFPRRWHMYVRAHFTGVTDLQRKFSVSEKAARNWWTGKGGVNGGYVSVAMSLHPHTAPAFLFAGA